MTDTYVIMSKKRRVRHIAVTGRFFPLCGNFGAFPVLERADESPHIPWCINCKTLSTDIYEAMR